MRHTVLVCTDVEDGNWKPCIHLWYKYQLYPVYTGTYCNNTSYSSTSTWYCIAHWLGSATTITTVTVELDERTNVNKMSTPANNDRIELSAVELLADEAINQWYLGEMGYLVTSGSVLYG